jgi:glycine hydroxymethyltransferase
VLLAQGPADSAAKRTSNGLGMSARDWLPEVAQTREAEIVDALGQASLNAIDAQVHSLVARTVEIHDRECVQLNPATNVMHPRAEAMLSSGIGTRPSLGYAGAKYEMGLEAVEEIEVIAASLARRVFDAKYAEIRVGSGAMANMYAFMATCKAGDTILVPPGTIGGHVTHNQDGAAGLLGLDIHEYPVDPSTYTADVDGVREMALRLRPRLITMGGSLNLNPHPVAAISAVAREVGAELLFDAAHACGMFAGRVWANPLTEGADLLTMSTYKSLGGPPGGLLLTNSADLAARVDGIAYPGLTANFDTGKTAALAIALLDWLHDGPGYASAMVATAQALAAALVAREVPLFTTVNGPTQSHQFAVDARGWGDGDAAARRLRLANVLASGIGLPGLSGPGADGMPGLRLGTPEIVRWGMGPQHMEELAALIADGLQGDPLAVATRTSAFRQRFTTLAFMRP